MNIWEYKKPFAIVEADDFMDQWDRNGLNFLFYWKAKYPNFKISLFTVPNRTTQGMYNLIMKHFDWIELLVHGWNHESNFECYGWDEEKTKTYMERVGRVGYYKKFFKAPGWTITPGYNGYPASDRDPLKENPQAVYRALKEIDFVVFDRHYNKPGRPTEDNIVCVDCQPDLVHFHTWNVPSGDINQRNGFQDIEENFGVPWDENTEFKFVSEAWKEGLFKPCV
jgi:hypothetical protein